MSEATDALVFIVVVLLRLGIPLLIPRFPLPAVVAALVIDAADQTIFQVLTNLNLDGYQSYDKALDIYYLTIAYISTMRNWANVFAFETSRFLWYYRLAGVTLFEMFGGRWLLLVFPNTFEYFFIFYEGVKTRWNPLRMSKRFVLGAAAFIWIFIKLPQEYWIHIAQLDTTDLIKEDILGVSADTGWGEAISENLWVIPVLIIIVAILAVIIRLVFRRLPTPDWKWTFNSDDHSDIPSLPDELPPQAWYHGLFEKVMLVGLVSVIFGHVLPDRGSDLTLFIAIGIIVVINAVVSQWFAKRDRRWRSTLTEFAAMTGINLAISIAIILIDASFDEEGLRIGIFLVLLLTLIITFYDHYRPYYDRRLVARSTAVNGAANSV